MSITDIVDEPFRNIVGHTSSPSTDWVATASPKLIAILNRELLIP